MSYLLAFHWGWLLGSSLLGLLAGWIAVVQRGRGTSKAVACWLAVLALVLVALALARIIPGRAGYWLDLWLAMFACYLLGCLVGSLLRDRVIARATRQA